MLNLTRYFSNPFNDQRINLLQLIDFASTHLARMVAGNPGGSLDARIAATSGALGGLEAATVDNGVKLGARKARVQAKEAFRLALPLALARVHGAVVAAFGVEAPELVQCFPQGRSVFITCPDHALDEKLGALQSGLVPLAAQVGQAHVNVVAGLTSSWGALMAEVGSAAASKNGLEAARREARRALAVELFRNVLALASLHPDDLSKADIYLPQHLLRKPARRAEAA